MADSPAVTAASTEPPPPGGAGQDDDLLRSAILTVTRGTIITMVGTIGFLALSLLWRVLIVRLISVEQWGEMSLTFALIALITALAPLGIQPAVTRSIAYERPEDQKGIAYSAMLITASSGLLFTIGLYLSAGSIASFFRDPALVPVIQILSPSIFLGMFIGTISAIFQGFQNVVPYALFVNVLPNIFSISLALLLYYLGFGFTGILISAVLNSFLVLLIMIPYSRSALRRHLEGKVWVNRTRMLLAFGLPLLVVTSLSSLMGYADTLILGYFRTETVVGYYSAGLALGRIVAFGLSALSFIFLPVASQMFSLKRYNDLERTYSTATKWSLTTSVPLLAIFVLYPAQSIAFTFGGEYSIAGTVLEISTFGAFIASLFGPAGSALVAFGRTKLLALNSIVSVIANVVISIVLIPPMGMDGGALASMAGILINGAMAFAEIAYYYRLHPFNRMYIKPLVVSVAVSFLFLVPLGLNPGLVEIPLIFAGILVLVIVSILVTKSVDKTDVLLLEVAEGILGRRLTRLRKIGTMLIGKTG